MKFDIKYAAGLTIFSYNPAALEVQGTNLVLTDASGTTVFNVPFTDINRVVSGFNAGMDKTSIKLSDHLYNVSLGSQRREILQQLRSNGVKVRDYAKFGAVTAIAAVVIAVVVLIIVLT